MLLWLVWHWQVIKRGITEVADIVAVNKADGPTRAAAANAAAAFKGTMHFHRSRRRGWSPTILTCSAHTGGGVEKLRRLLEEFRLAVTLSGELAQVSRDKGCHSRMRSLCLVSSTKQGCQTILGLKAFEAAPVQVVPCFAALQSLIRENACILIDLSFTYLQGRQLQRRKLTWAATEEVVLEGLRSNANVWRLFDQMWPDIKAGKMAPRSAANLLAQTYAEYD
jgi:putative protein kinase ArgK-like GTPase of G3E family